MPVDERRIRENQREEIIDRTAPPDEVIYQAVYAEGEHELERNSLELAFSGLAAGSLLLGLNRRARILEFAWFVRAVGAHAEFFEAEEVSE
jgi:hypothetical protein